MLRVDEVLRGELRRRNHAFPGGDAFDGDSALHSHDDEPARSG